MLTIDLDQCRLYHPAYGEQSLRVTEEDFIEDKMMHQYIKNIERLIRTSPEYKNWLNFVRNVLGEEHHCYHTGEHFSTCSIHMHHHPLTLYDYVIIAMEKIKKFDTFYIAEEVMAYHFCNYIGFIPLCSTTHEKYHSGMFKIPIELIEGNWRLFIEEYKDVIPEYLIDKVDTLSSVTLDNCDDTWYNTELKYTDINSKPFVFEDNHIIRSNIKKEWGIEEDEF